VRRGVPIFSLPKIIGFFVVAFFIVSPLRSARAETFKLGQLEITNGVLTRFRVPVPPVFKADAAKGGNPYPAFAQAAIVLPDHFTNNRAWPIMVISATSDGDASSVAALSRFAGPLSTNGWIGIAADGPAGKPANDSLEWRGAMVLSTLDYLNRFWPTAAKWPIVPGGFSGGAKWSGCFAPYLAAKGYRVAGVFMGGCNEDRLGQYTALYRPPETLKAIPVFLCAGKSDPLVSREDMLRVENSMRQAGFKNIRVETYPGGHHLDFAAFQSALEWFAPPKAAVKK
jgi:hypothetical protein